MWLLDTSTLALSAFFDEDNTPHYAILSHTWGSEEVSFQDIKGPHDRISDWLGYKKIKKCCEQALEVGFKYVWIDTACIDKTNSSELSESINSMFRWYKNSTTCYAYLEDVKPSALGIGALKRSRWFTRGWTLQELIAPTDVRFFDFHWNEIGSRASLGNIIRDITGVPLPVLKHGSSRDYCIAEIMSWAAGRKTTRIEDRAYSLLGLFHVSMPLLYGEGAIAFLRLQLEILKTTTDHSLFAWFLSTNYRGPGRGALAISPDEFKDSGHVYSFPGSNMSSFEMTNLGLRITLPCVTAEAKKPAGRRLFAWLNCGSRDQGGLLGIELREVAGDGKGMRRFYRHGLTLVSENHALYKLPRKSTLVHIIQPRHSHISETLPMKLVSVRDPTPCSLDFTILFRIGYRLEADPSLVSSPTPRNEEFKLTSQLVDSTAWVLFFKHIARETRFWVSLYVANGTLWPNVETTVADTDTVHHVSTRVKLGLFRRSEPPPWRVLYTIPKHVTNSEIPTDANISPNEVLKLTVRRAVVYQQLGFLVQIAMFDSEQDVYC